MTTHKASLVQASDLFASGDMERSEKICRQFLTRTPLNSQAWCLLGQALHGQSRFTQAALAYRRALKIRPDYGAAYKCLGNTLHAMDHQEESIHCYDRALSIEPNDAVTLRQKAVALIYSDRLSEALPTLYQSLRYDPSNADTRVGIGLVLLLHGDYKQGWYYYGYRRNLKSWTQPSFQQPIWTGNSLDRKTILVVTEQGFGDTIHFIRYSSLLKARYNCHILVKCDPSLVSLLATCPDIDGLVGDDDDVDFDYFVPLMDLPGLFEDTLSTVPNRIPYLRADPDRLAKWRTYFTKYTGVRIAVVWQGNPTNAADHLRSFALQDLVCLNSLEGITLFSIQKHFGLEQLQEVEHQLKIVPLGHMLDNETDAFLDTAAVLEHVDLLVSADTALAHLAGALGVTTWLVLPTIPDWRWCLDRDDTPWYPRTTLFRQSVRGNWRDVFDRVKDRLLKYSSAIRQKQYKDYRVRTDGSTRLTQTRNGLMFYNRFDCYIGRALDRYGEYSEQECALFRLLVRPGDVVIDAGANVGAHTLVFSRLVGDRGMVHAYEPQPVVFTHLNSTLQLNHCVNVVTHGQGLGSKRGDAYIPALDYDAAGNFGGVELGQYEDGNRVVITTIDSLKLEKCSFLKADVEGMELDVLAGASDTIDKCRPIIYVENDRQNYTTRLVRYIKSKGYLIADDETPLFNPNNYFCNSKNEFGNLVSKNLLGVCATRTALISAISQYTNLKFN